MWAVFLLICSEEGDLVSKWGLVVSGVAYVHCRSINSLYAGLVWLWPGELFDPSAGRPDYGLPRGQITNGSGIGRCRHGAHNSLFGGVKWAGADGDLSLCRNFGGVVCCKTAVINKFINNSCRLIGLLSLRDGCRIRTAIILSNLFYGKNYC